MVVDLVPTGERPASGAAIVVENHGPKIVWIEASFEVLHNIRIETLDFGRGS